MNRKQFNILVFLEAQKAAKSQREIAAATEMSVGSVNKAMAELSANGLVAEGKITEAGVAALEPYRVKRAVFFAAGFGARLVPITLNTPKPLVRVKGKRIIDSLLDAVIAAGIEEIYIVRGYLAEQFDQLLLKYPNIKFIENPIYNEANNVSSAYFAREVIKNSYVLESDLLLHNPKLITKYQYASNYLGVPTPRTEDWCLLTDNTGRVKKVGIGGEGANCNHLFGISYWNEEDGTRLCGHLKEYFETVPGGKERYWDQVALEYYVDQYNVYVNKCTFDDICEIDTFNELKQIDSSYAV